MTIVLSARLGFSMGPLPQSQGLVWAATGMCWGPGASLDTLPVAQAWGRTRAQKLVAAPALDVKVLGGEAWVCPTIGPTSAPEVEGTEKPFVREACSHP